MTWRDKKQIEDSSCEKYCLFIVVFKEVMSQHDSERSNLEEPFSIATSLIHATRDTEGCNKSQRIKHGHERISHKQGQISNPT